MAEEKREQVVQQALQGTTQIVRLQNPELLAKDSFASPWYERTKAHHTIEDDAKKLSMMPQGMKERGGGAKLQKEIEEARNAIALASSSGNQDQQERSELRKNHAASSFGSPFVSGTPNYTLGPGSQDDYAGRNIQNRVNGDFGAIVTVAQVDNRRVQNNEHNTAESELLVTGGIKKEEVSHTYWSYMDDSRGGQVTNVFYDHAKDEMHFGDEANKRFGTITKPVQLGKK